jgi:hypothetical protein
MALAQQGAEAVGQIISIEPSNGNQRGQPLAGNRYEDRAKLARSEEATSASGNRRLAEGDARWRIT